MDRRAFLGCSAAAVPSLGATRPSDSINRVALAWADTSGVQWVGAFNADPAAARLQPLWQQRLPGRAHGLTVLRDGALVVTAVRPGRWLLRLDADGQRVALLDLAEAGEHTTLGGHAATGDGVLFTAEADTDGQGRIGVRDGLTLHKLDEWASGGIEPHHLLLDGPRLLVAHGGIRRGAGDTKLGLDSMASSLDALATRSGRHLLQWRLPDSRLSMRHLAALPRRGEPALIGVALQAEHDAAEWRQAAPGLAVCDGARLHLVGDSHVVDGYAGDIAAAGDGFVFSSPRSQGAWHWQPGRGCTRVAHLQQASALIAGSSDGRGAVWIAGRRGLGRWDDAAPAALLGWPGPLAVDNHGEAWN